MRKSKNKKINKTIKNITSLVTAEMVSPPEYPRIVVMLYKNIHI